MRDKHYTLTIRGHGTKTSVELSQGNDTLLSLMKLDIDFKEACNIGLALIDQLRDARQRVRKARRSDKAPPPPPGEGGGMA